MADVEQVLAAWTTHLDRLQLRDQTMEVERLIRILERSGLAYENGQIIWKEQPPQLHGGKATGTQSADELWEPDHFRLFLSHVSSFKEKTAQLRRELQKYQISGFVAHEDILPSREWQFELERALKSMDALAAILTQGYHESDWTDQEVGFALGRGVLVLSVRRDRDPYGFIARQQAVPGSSKKIGEVARSIYQALELIP